MGFRTSDSVCEVNGIAPGVLIFLLACVSNLILALVMPRVDWSLRGETSRIAASLATGHGFSSPFRLPTGPSALIPPVYPFLLAGIFRVFGVYTIASDWAATIFNILVHGLSCVLLFQTAAETFDRRSGILAAVALATFPLLFYPLVMLHVLGNVNAGAGLFIPPRLDMEHVSLGVCDSCSYPAHAAAGAVGRLRSRLGRRYSHRSQCPFRCARIFCLVDVAPRVLAPSLFCASRDGLMHQSLAGAKLRGIPPFHLHPRWTRS